MNAYLFILCPPYSGSTLLWKLVSTSSHVSSLPLEGQFLPEVKDVMRRAPWSDDETLPWEKIKKVWDQYWDQGKLLLVEKSPPHIIRTREIIEHFRPVHFIIMVRNPYALCEGLMRRNRWAAQEAAEFTVRCMRQQMENKEELTGALSFTYEEMVTNPKHTAQKIQEFLPQTGDLNPHQSFKIHSIDGVIDRGIVDLNKKKIDRLSIVQLRNITEVLKENADVMAYWKYGYIEPSLVHALNYYRTRILVRLVDMKRRILTFKAHQQA